MKSKLFQSAPFLSMALAAIVVITGFGSSPVLSQQRDATLFSGSIGNARLEMELKREGQNLTGSYYYRKSGSTNRLMLKGTIAADGQFTMRETDAAGKQTGEFKGKWKAADADENGASLEGQWLKPGEAGEGQAFYGFEQMIYFGSTQITTRDFKESIKAKKATLSAEYPELSGNANAAGFNQLAKSGAMRSLANFKKDLAGVTAADIKQMGEMGYYIEVAYGVEYADDDLISVNFVEYTFSGGAHPNSNNFTLTYDLKAGRELKLADLFKPGSKYLDTIAEYCLQDLKARKDPESGENLGIAQDLFEDGAKPTVDNYSNWNITKKGLLITFPAYQVAAYAYGPQQVIVPFSKLKAITRPDGALKLVEKKAARERQ